MIFNVIAIKIGSLKFHPHIAKYRKIEVPAETEREAMIKAERRLGAEWGVFSADLRGKK